MLRGLAGRVQTPADVRRLAHEAREQRLDRLAEVREDRRVEVLRQLGTPLRREEGSVWHIGLAAIREECHEVIKLGLVRLTLSALERVNALAQCARSVQRGFELWTAVRRAVDRHSLGGSVERPHELDIVLPLQIDAHVRGIQRYNGPGEACAGGRLLAVWQDG